MGVSKGLKIVQLSYQLKKQMAVIRDQNTPCFPEDFDSGSFEKRAPGRLS